MEPKSHHLCIREVTRGTALKALAEHPKQIHFFHKMNVQIKTCLHKQGNFGCILLYVKILSIMSEKDRVKECKCL